MAIPTKTLADLRYAVRDQIHGDPDAVGASTVIDRIIKRAVRENTSDIDLRSAKRSVALALSGQNDVIYDESDGFYDLPSVQAIGAQAAEFEYLCPTDLKGQAVIDIKARTSRVKEYGLTTQEEFDRRKLFDTSLFAISDNQWLRKLLVSGVPTLNTALLHDCDTYNGNGTFTAVGTATTVATEVTEFVEGDGAVSFTSGTGNTTAGIQNTTMTAVDLTAYDDHDLFVWVKVPATAAISSVSSFTLRWGSSSSNYWSVSVTKTHEQLAFFNGWNLLRFSWADATVTGTPDITAVDFVSFFMNKTSGMASVAGWIVDRIIAAINSNTDVVYYSKYGWQTSAGAYIEDASADTDFLNADTEEFDLHVLRACMFASIKLGSSPDIQLFDGLFNRKKEQYLERYPSEAKLLTTHSYNLSSLQGLNVTRTD